VTQTTRLNNYDRENTVTTLLNLLSNITKFVDMPVKDKATIINLWHAKFPPELFEAIDTLKQLGYGTNTSGENFRIAVEMDGQVFTAMMKTAEIPIGPSGEPKLAPLKLSAELARNPDMLCKIKGEVWTANAMPMTPEYIHKHLGSDADAFLAWMRETAQLRDELHNAAKVIKDVFTMAKTAGQIKRMVPDMLQYLPEELRKACEEQKRSSILPFEWAPYDKSAVDAMILTVSKGHLLTGMGKPNRENYFVGHLDGMMWGARAEWVD
jgi:hypothetical protein